MSLPTSPQLQKKGILEHVEDRTIYSEFTRNVNAKYVILRRILFTLYLITIA